MTRVLASRELQEALARDGRRVEVVDETGRLFCYVVTPAELERLESIRRSQADTPLLVDRKEAER